jgi:type I restriction enzyme M protein
MPSKRVVLEALKRDELLEALDLFELDVADRRVRVQLIDALSGSRKARLAELLAELPRARLKEICRALGLEDFGREKALLIARLTGTPAFGPAPSVSSAGLVRSTPSTQVATAQTRKTGARANIAPSRAVQDLKSQLWNCAEILRGSAVDRTDWKAYILPLLFFKRICDVWDEETAEATNLYGDVDPFDFPEVHRFNIPEGCHWGDVRATPSNVGAALSYAMREIERANPDTLYRVFGAADWGNREILTDEILKDLIEGLSEVPLGNTTVASDILGDAYEYLIGKFADVTKRKKAGEFYTPRSVVRMMIDILDPKAGESIYDPACGTGGMLLAAIDHVQRAGGDPRTFFGKIYGQEKNLTTSAIARMNLVLHGIEDFQVVREDTLRSPAFTDSSTGGLATFDCVVANPPFSLEEWGREVWEADPWGRAAYGLPPDSYGDYAWVQHMVASMALNTGRMAVVLPQGALFRKGAEGRIRQALLEQDLISAVIGLAPNIFFGTGLAPAVMILRRAKPAKRKEKVLVIDASSLFRKGRAQNFLDPEHAQKIVDWVRVFADVENYAKVVSLDKIKAEDWTLNISRYVLPPIGEEIPPLREAVAAFKLALSECRAAEDHLRDVLTEGGWLA